MTEEEIQDLKAENQRLKDELNEGKIFSKKKWGKRFKRAKWVAEAYTGKGLKNAFNKLFTEVKEQKTVTQDTLSEISTQLIVRFTRVGKIGLLIALIPIVFTLLQTWLLFNQNELVKAQNQLADNQNQMLEQQNRMFDKQNQLVEGQNKMFQNQNDLVQSQNDLVGQQNDKFDLQNRMFNLQNSLVQNQNSLIQHQSERLDQQTYLQEASRRSSFVFLMGNIFDEVNNELREDYNKDGIRNLSPQLIGRIIALSHSLTPYKFLVGDNLTDREYSPERGQLLITLVNSDIDSASLETIYFNANFTQSYLENVTFKEKNLKYCDLSKSNLKRANLQSADLTLTKLIDATLIGTDFSYAKLFRTDFNDANLRSAFLFNANFNDPNLIGALIDEKTIINMDDINKYRKCFYDTDTKTDTRIYQLSLVDCSDAPNKKQKGFLKNYHLEY